MAENFSTSLVGLFKSLRSTMLGLLSPSFRETCSLNLELTRVLTLNAPIAANVVCFSRLLKCLRSLYGKQCGPRSNCSYRSSQFWVHAVCFYTLFVSNVRQLFAADDFSRRHFQMHFFLVALRVKMNCSSTKRR